MADVELPPSEQLLYTTVRIEATNGKSVGTGTGFLYRFVDDGENHVPAIVTNRHVVEGFTQGTFHLNISGTEGRPLVGEHVPVSVDKFEARWIPHPEADVDLCVMPIAPILNAAKAQGKKPFFRMLSGDLLLSQEQLDELLPIEDVAMVGYPSGIWDDAGVRPVSLDSP